MHAPIIETEQLILRGTTMADWDPYATMWADPRVTNFIGGEPRPRDVAWLKFVQGAGQWGLLGYGYWSIVHRNGGYLGVGGFACQERGMPELEGYPEAGWAFAADAWGNGYATEFIGAATRWADEMLDAPETRCIIAPDNAPSIRVAEKGGYTRITTTQTQLGPLIVFRRPKQTG